MASSSTPNGFPTWFEPAAIGFHQQVVAGLENLTAVELADYAERLDHREQTFLTREALCLYPGANILSPRVSSLLGSVVATRASEGHPGAKYQTGLEPMEEAEVLAAELIRRLFDTRYAEVRTLSGSMANMAVLNALTEPGDTIFSLPTPVGGHISHAQVGAAGYRRLNIRDIPYDPFGWQIKLDEFRQAVKKRPPIMIIIGASLILFEYPVKEIRQIADEVGAILMYDAAHVAGLVAGRGWQHPLREGAHVMTASTYKSFGGPPGGIVVTDDRDIAKGVDRAVFPGMTANFHTQRLPALAVAAAEMLEHGAAYAHACRENAQALAAAFETQHLTVAGKARGYSDGHMLALDVSEFEGGYQAAKALEVVHIICNMNLLPWDPLTAVRNPSGVRLGVHELTRWGMGTEQMQQVGALFADVFLKRRSADAIRHDVIALKQSFEQLHYCFSRE